MSSFTNSFNRYLGDTFCSVTTALGFVFLVRLDRLRLVGKYCSTRSPIVCFSTNHLPSVDLRLLISQLGTEMCDSGVGQAMT